MTALAFVAAETSGVLANAIASGNRDENKLTNIVFFGRHPELNGRKLRPDERALANEWMTIRDTIVRPALRAAAAPTLAPTTTSSAAPARPPIPASRLEWPGATDEQLAFMRSVYESHYARARRGDRPYIADLPDAALDTIERRHRARKDAARAARDLLAAARASLAAEGLTGKAEIGIVSAYRPAAHQFVIWQGKGRSGGFPHYYAATRPARRRLGDEHGPDAVKHLTAVIAKKIAAPGFSNHQDGLAIDFATGGAGGRDFGKIGEKAWFFSWLKENAARFGFQPYPEEAWHWIYRGAAGTGEQETMEESPSAAPVAIRAGKLPVARVPLLARHRGNPPDLVLRWNDMPSRPKEIDVVVHLHGYSRAGMTLRDDIERWSGLDLAAVDGASGQGRSRPTLTVLPRAHFTGEQRGKLYKYTFPALVAKGALPELVRFALQRFAAAARIDEPRLGRLILTAHSGGGAPLLRILRDHDPHEVHVFDGLYQHAGPLAQWARRHIAQDKAAPGLHGGALRVFYRGTRKFSRQLLDDISAELASAPADVRRRYRVESSSLGHWQIARQYGWRVLADAAADVPNVSSEPMKAHELDEEARDMELESVIDYEDVGEAEVEAESEAFLPTFPFVSGIQDALRQRLWPLAVSIAIASGNRDENQLTTMLFSARHPELQGRKIRPEERDLAKEWLAIREKIIRPLLKGPKAIPPTATSAPTARRSPAGVSPAAIARQPSQPPTIQTVNCGEGEYLVRDDADFVPEIKNIMKERGWDVATRLQTAWVESPANQLVGAASIGNGTAGPLAVLDVSIEWALTFERTRSLYETLMQPSKFANVDAREVLQKKIAAKLQRKLGQEVEFGNLTAKGRALEAEYTNYEPLSNFAAYEAGVDALAAALGRFTMYVIPSGKAVRRGWKTVVTISKLGIYLRDSYDFNGEQDLGFWHKPDEVRIDAPPEWEMVHVYPRCSYEWFEISNASFRTYRKRTGLGADFVVYSDIKSVNLGTPVTFEY